MASFLEIHPDNPQPRLINQVADQVRRGAVIIYPTDSCYALGCHLGDKAAAERLRRIRQFDKHHLFTLVCRDLSDLATYARVDNAQYRLLKSMTPGPFTFILKATKQAPRRLLHEKRQTIGLRVPEHTLTQHLLAALGEPILSCTLQLPGEDQPITDIHEVRDRLDHAVDVMVSGGDCGIEPTTVINLVEDVPELVRQGKGDASWLFDD